MDKQDKEIRDSRRGSQVSTRSSTVSKPAATLGAADAEIAKLKQQLEIERLRAELAELKTAEPQDKTSRPRRDRQRTYSSSSTGSSESSACGSSCSSNAAATVPSNSSFTSPFGNSAASPFADMHNSMYGGKVQGAKWRIRDINAGGVSCDKGNIDFKEFFFSDCKNIIIQYQPVREAHLRDKKTQEARAENGRKRKAFLDTYTHVEFQTIHRHPELISESRKSHHHRHHRHGHLRRSGRDKTVHTLPYDPLNPFLGPRPGGF